MTFDDARCEDCINYHKCDLEDMKDHLYNIRDGTEDCFKKKDE